MPSLAPWPSESASRASGRAGRVTVAELLAHGYDVVAADLVQPPQDLGWPDPTLRKWNLWGYIDERDAAAACRLALEAPAEGSASYIIAAADTGMNRPSEGLLREVFPGVPLTRDVGEFGSLLAADRARDALGFVPRHSWRDTWTRPPP